MDDLCNTQIFSNHNSPVLTCKCTIGVLELKAKFSIMNVVKWGKFTLIGPDFAQEEVHSRISKLVRSGRTLVPREVMDKVPGQTNNGIPDL